VKKDGKPLTDSEQRRKRENHKRIEDLQKKQAKKEAKEEKNKEEGKAIRKTTPESKCFCASANSSIPGASGFAGRTF